MTRKALAGWLAKLGREEGERRAESGEQQLRFSVSQRQESFWLTSHYSFVLLTSDGGVEVRHRGEEG